CESLPGEIVFLQRETANKAFEPFAQHEPHFAPAGQCFVLRRRNAEAIERRGLAGQPADEFALEERRKLLVEEAALPLDRRRVEQGAERDAIEPRQQMRDANEMSKQPVAIEAAREKRDAAAA